MLKKVVSYKDFNGDTVTEELYFHLSAAEMVRLDMEFKGGLRGEIERLDPQNNPRGTMDLFERMLQASYGKKTEDGKHFLKEADAAFLFKSSAVYDTILLQLLSDADAAMEFFVALVPSEDSLPDVNFNKS